MARMLRVLFLPLLIALLPACQRAGDGAEAAAGAPLLPRLATRQDKVEHLMLRGAGDKLLVQLELVDGEWRLGERAWARADGARIAKYLLELANAKRVEAKTDRPALYSQIGVEAVQSPEAGGHELYLWGPGITERLIIGKQHKVSGGRYVRMREQAASWLTDVDIGFPETPEAWLEHRILEVPIARVQRVAVRTPGMSDFSLSSREDRFRLDGAPVGAMGESLAGDAIAGALQGLEIEDVGPVGTQAPSRVLEYELVDGAVLALAVVRDGPRDWLRVSASVDAARAQEWAKLSGRAQVPQETAAQVREWNRRFEGRRYLVSQALAATLMQDPPQILEGAPAQAAP